MLNDVMTLAEASVIWGIKYEGLLKCITAGPLDQPKFHDDEVGRYNPCVSPALLSLNDERLDYWMSCGAQPTDTVARLIKSHKGE